MMETKSQLLQAMKICRFCFSDNECELSQIYEKKKDSKPSVPLPLQIMAMAIEVFPNDGMPQFICVNCKQQAQECYIFRANCKKAHEALKQFLHTDKNEIHQPTFQYVKNAVKAPPREFKVVTKMSATSGTTTQSRKLNDGTELITLTIQTPLKEEQKQVAKQRPYPTSDNNPSEDGQEPMDVGNPIEYEIINDEKEDPPLKSGESDEKMDENVPTDVNPCPLCERNFSSEDLLNIHLNVKHKLERPYHCDLCNKKFLTKNELKNHEPAHSDLETRVFQCRLCEKTFAREHMLRRHQLVHNNDYCVRCVKCGETFATKVHLEEHIFADHTRSENYQCNVCDKSFVFKQGLDRHMLIHEETPSESYSCSYCDKRFRTAIEQVKHVSEHAELRPYCCKVCKRNFTVNHHLTRHMKWHAALECGTPPEEIVGRYKCDLCSMAFKKQADLLEHSIVHSIVNVTCVICNTSFPSSSAVKDHIKIHLKELAFPCENCDYSFEYAEQLEVHLLKHAQMEYEEKIEEDLIREARRPSRQQVSPKNVPSTPQRKPKTTAGPKSRLIRCSEQAGEIVYTINMEHEETLSEKPPLEPPPPHREPSPERVLPIFGQEHTEFEAEEQDDLSTTYLSEMEDEAMDEHMEAISFNAERQEADEAVEYNREHLFKCEVDSDDGQDAVTLDDDDRDAEHEEEEVLKPIVRNEGTKMYARKGPIERKPIQMDETPLESRNLASPDEINESATQMPLLDLTPENVPIAKSMQTNLEKIGNKVVKVQKFILTKGEIKKMQKQGLIEVRGGKVVLKSQNSSILDASIKPVQKDDIDHFIKSAPRPQLRSYHRRITESEASILESAEPFRSQIL